MTGPAIDLRLSTARPGDVKACLAAWGSTTITLVLPGLVGFADHPSIGNKLRGALGMVLLQSASPDVMKRKPCTWRRTCAAEVFFGSRPLISVSGISNEIPKPLVLWTEKGPAGALLVRCRVFGFARGWTSAVTEALVEAVQDVVFWQRVARDVGMVSVPRITPMDVAETEDQIQIPQPTMVGAEMVFLSPIDADRGDPVEQPKLILHRLILRVTLLARWMGVDLGETAGRLLSRERPDEEIELADGFCQEPSRKGGQRFANHVARPVTFHLRGDLSAISPYLAIGELSHVGRGTTVGLGRYRLVAFQGDEGEQAEAGRK